MSFNDIVTNSIYFYSCISQEHGRSWGKRKVFLKEQTFICLSLPKVLGLKMQEIPKTEKERRPSEAW